MIKLTNKARHISGETIYKIKGTKITITVKNILCTTNYLIYSCFDKATKEEITYLYNRENNQNYECVNLSTERKNEEGLKTLITGMRGLYAIVKPINDYPLGLSEEDFKIMIKNYFDILGLK